MGRPAAARRRHYARSAPSPVVSNRAASRKGCGRDSQARLWPLRVPRTLSVASGSTPGVARRRATTGVWPHMAAKCRGVAPVCKGWWVSVEDEGGRTLDWKECSRASSLRLTTPSTRIPSPHLVEPHGIGACCKKQADRFKMAVVRGPENSGAVMLRVTERIVVGSAG